MGRLLDHGPPDAELRHQPPAGSDINTYLNEHAPKNLTYDRHPKGYKPGAFQPLFIDGSASAYLHLLDQNRVRAPHIEGLALAMHITEVLQVPDRSIRPEVLRPILQACREGCAWRASTSRWPTRRWRSA